MAPESERAKNECIHAGSGVEMYAFNLPIVGLAMLCWDCRKELVLRTHSFKEFGLVAIGGLGYKCSRCGGNFTCDDAQTCTCPGRKEECDETRKANQAFREYATLVLWKPKEPRNSCGLSQGNIVHPEMKRKRTVKTKLDTRVKRALAVLTEDRPGNYPEDDHANRTNQMDEAITILRERRPVVRRRKR